MNWRWSIRILIYIYISRLFGIKYTEDRFTRNFLAHRSAVQKKGMNLDICVYRGDGVYLGYVSGGSIYRGDRIYLGYVVNDLIYRGDKLYLGYVRANSIYRSDGVRLGYVNSNSIFRGDGLYYGYVTGSVTMQQAGGAAFLLVLPWE
jgi:hypothetical protein